MILGEGCVYEDKDHGDEMMSYNGRAFRGVREVTRLAFERNG
jgi:hypothetical protein